MSGVPRSITSPSPEACLGLTVEQAGAIGWSKTSLPDETAARYRRELSALARALTASRGPEAGGPPRPDEQQQRGSP